MRPTLPGRSLLRKAVVAATALFSLMAGGQALAANKTNLSIFQHQKPVNYMPCGSQPLKYRSAVLMGGGVDVPSAFTFMIDKMNTCAKPANFQGYGNFVVVRAGGNPSYDSYIYKQGPVAAVITIVIPDRDSAMALADKTNETGQQAMQLLQSAGAIWLTGGDQGDYYNFWKGTPVEALISSQAKNYNIPVGGTSAGMMILSQFNYIPDLSYSSSYALQNPAAMQQWLKNDFWSSREKTPFPLLTNTVTDSHFHARDRMGRLVTFLADTIDMKLASKTAARGLAVDQEAALLMSVDPATGAADPYKIVANDGSYGAAYVLRASSDSTINTRGNLTFTKINVEKYSYDPSAADYKAARTTYKFDVINLVPDSTGVVKLPESVY